MNHYFVQQACDNQNDKLLFYKTIFENFQQKEHRQKQQVEQINLVYDEEDRECKRNCERDNDKKNKKIQQNHENHNYIDNEIDRERKY